MLKVLFLKRVETTITNQLNNNIRRTKPINKQCRASNLVFRSHLSSQRAWAEHLGRTLMAQDSALLTLRTRSHTVLFKEAIGRFRVVPQIDHTFCRKQAAKWRRFPQKLSHLPLRATNSKQCNLYSHSRWN